MNDVAGFLIPHEYEPNRGHGQGGQKETGDRCLVGGCGQPELHGYHAMPKPDIDKAIAKASGTNDGPPDMSKTVAAPPSAKTDWVGDNPFWLMCQTSVEGGNVGIDLDEAGWIEKNKVLMRSAGTWFLMAKRTGKPLFSVVLDEGDQFYYAKRHVGNLMAAKEVLCYGIGKKKADGTPVNLWLLPNGMVCGGDDVDVLAARMI